MFHPPPDISRSPRIAGQTVVEVIYGHANRVRGIITIDERGVYRVRTEVWDTGDWDVAGAAFWSHMSGASFTDTLESAREICHDGIRAAAGRTE